jgi:hypothetical protein
MRYTMDRSGIGQMMKRAPFIDHAVRQGAQRTLAIAQSRVPVRTGQLRSSGRTENAGIQPVKRGESRITWRVVFHSRYAMDIEMKTGFLSGSVKRRVR